jgi:hypothetical protein
MHSLSYAEASEFAEVVILGEAHERRVQRRARQCRLVSEVTAWTRPALVASDATSAGDPEGRTRRKRCDGRYGNTCPESSVTAAKDVH